MAGSHREHRAKPANGGITHTQRFSRRRFSDSRDRDGGNEEPLSHTVLEGELVIVQDASMVGPMAMVVRHAPSVVQVRLCCEAAAAGPRHQLILRHYILGWPPDPRKRPPRIQLTAQRMRHPGLNCPANVRATYDCSRPQRGVRKRIANSSCISPHCVAPASLL